MTHGPGRARGLSAATAPAASGRCVSCGNSDLRTTAAIAVVCKAHHGMVDGYCRARARHRATRHRAGPAAGSNRRLGARGRAGEASVVGRGPRRHGTRAARPSPAPAAAALVSHAAGGRGAACCRSARPLARPRADALGALNGPISPSARSLPLARPMDEPARRSSALTAATINDVVLWFAAAAFAATSSEHGDRPVLAQGDGAREGA